ncbi:hypothetical protein TNCV_4140821 [Trichonephila clavipes]|nr:hypothetical protein TNCV_4140821 [Trichonephila clavipes]
MWLYYCKLRGANDFESVNQLIVADKLFEMLDSEMATHIGVLQGEERRAIEDKLSKLVKTSISVDGRLVHALVDSGTKITVIKKDLVPGISVEGASTIYLKGIFGSAVKCSVVYVPIGLATGGQVNVVHQQVLCALTEVLVEDVLLPPDVLDMLGGAHSEENSLAQSSQDLSVDSGSVDETEVSLGILPEKAQEDIEDSQRNITSCRNEVGKLGTKDEEVTAEMDKGSMVADSFRSEQECCAELALAWKHAKEGKGNYYEVDGYLFHGDKILGALVILKYRKTEVLKLAHTSVFSSHMGPKKTPERIKYSFFWEGLRANVKKFCESCKECQLTRSGGEAVPLTSLSAKETCEALLSIFSRTGIPNVVASDNGTNLAAELNKEFEKRIGSSPIFSTPGYPQSNGLVERFNRALKNMLHNVVRDEGRGGHLQAPYLLWAYREIPHSTTGVSPFQLLYGRQPQGPLSILKSTWTGKYNNLQLCTTPVSKYLEDLKCKLEKVAEQAKLVSTVQQEKMAYYHNLRSSDRVFKVGEKVIVLIPDATSKLFARWQGPATIIEKRNPHSFLVEMPDNSTKHIHQNKLMHYVASSNSVNVIFEEEKEFGQVETPPTVTEESKFYEVSSII